MPETTLNSLSVTVLIIVLFGVWLYRLRFIDQREFFEPSKALVFNGRSFLTFPVNWAQKDHELLFGIRFKTTFPDGMLYLNKVYEDKFYCVYLQEGQLYLNKGLNEINKVLLWSTGLHDGTPHVVKLYWTFEQLVVEVDNQPVKYVTPPNTLPMVNGRKVYIGGGPVHLDVEPFKGCIFFVETPTETFTYRNFSENSGVKIQVCDEVKRH